ncbi:MAG: nucleotidyltransferase family protein [Undibacterium sp.]|uniref:nucleotidyltransferase domain-containing protein n=1 Tax=Undibacterium sp. TaxID=1914977 RepID=UPI002722A3FE|nr:nucleotidyltransferase family protein [Undibacterium sp.]MDO8652613.1 nucleotidyltransferase family protein [Undibacterium sp.]
MNTQPSLTCPLDVTGNGPEFEFLLTCCRPQPSAAHVVRQRALAAAGLDTGKLLALGIRHKISPLLYRNVKAHPPGSFAEELLPALELQQQRNTQRALRALHASHELGRATQGLQLLGLKGMDVAIRAYGDLAVRHVGDIDIVVAPLHFERVLAVLKAQGWAIAEHDILALENRRLLSYGHHHGLLLRQNFPPLELHWRASYNPYEFPLDWPTLRTAALAQTSLAGLHHEDLLIYLCLHGVTHGWARLKWLFDLPNLIETHTFDWPRVWQRAHQLDAGLALQQGLLLAQQYCGLHLSAEIRQGFRFKLSPSQWHLIQLFQQGPELWMEKPPARIMILTWMHRMRNARQWKALLWHLMAMLYPSVNDYRLLKLPARLQWLYFPLRPLTWTFRRLQGLMLRMQSAQK